MFRRFLLAGALALAMVGLSQAQEYRYNGLNVNLSNLYRLSDAQTRSISRGGASLQVGRGETLAGGLEPGPYLTHGDSGLGGVVLPAAGR